MGAASNFRHKKRKSGRYFQGWEFAHLFSERIAHGHSFLVSDLSDSLTSLIKKREWANCSLFFKTTYKKHTIKFDFSQIFWANRSFAHLSWATWVNPSRSLICHEWPEQFAHSCSFDMSDQSDSLTVAHLSWVIWVNLSQSLVWFEWSERMSEFPALEFSFFFN